MKIIVFFIFFLSFFGFSQNESCETISFKKTCIYEVNKGKQDIYISALKWVSKSYKSSTQVIKMSDSISGTIIIKGVSTITYENTMKDTMENNPYVQEFNQVPISHTIEINIKPERYRAIFSVDDLNDNSSLVSLNGINEEEFLRFSAELDDSLKKALMGKKKRENYIAATYRGYELYHKSLNSEVNSILKSLNSEIISDEKW